MIRETHMGRGGLSDCGIIGRNDSYGSRLAFLGKPTVAPKGTTCL